MNKRLISSALDYEEFNEILSQQNWFKLLHEFELRGTSLSQSFLIWEEEASNTWLLVDFKTEKAYEIKGNLNTEKQGIVSVSETSSQKEQLINQTNPHLIFPRITQGSKGTDEGFIDLFTKLKHNLVQINLENLKRPELLGAGFSFESAYHNMFIVHKKFCEIFTSTNESLIDIPRSDLQSVVNYLKQFYGYASRIADFEIIGENPRQDYSSLLVDVSAYCENTKNSLRNHIAYLNSNKVEQLESQIKSTLAAAEERIRTAIGSETEKLQKIGEEAQQGEEERKESFDQIYTQLKNQLANEQLKKYKMIFQNQAKKHGRMSWVWLAVTGVLTVGFAVIFWELLTDIGSAANRVNQLSTILSNLFVRGFYISLIFLLLNRTIKNYSAEKHLEVINTHRQNALDTFEAFADAAGAGDTREQVLLAATKTIFDANQSGYLSAKTTGSDSASPVQHFIKEVLPSKPSSDSN